MATGKLCNNSALYCTYIAQGLKGSRSLAALCNDQTSLFHCAFIIIKTVTSCSTHKIDQQVHVPNFGGLSGSEDRGGGDNSIQFINFGRVGDKSFEEWLQKLGGWKGG